jgi:hypothetical protein
MKAINDKFAGFDSSIQTASISWENRITVILNTLLLDTNVILM